jgi:hypothetical protein
MRARKRKRKKKICCKKCRRRRFKLLKRLRARRRQSCPRCPPASSDRDNISSAIDTTASVKGPLSGFNVIIQMPTNSGSANSINKSQESNVSNEGKSSSSNGSVSID